MFIKMALKKYVMIDYHDGCGRGDKACPRKLAQALFPTHTFWQSYTRNMSHNSLCSLPLFCSILGARCHQEKLAQAFSDTWCRLSPKACASCTSRKSLIKYDDLIIIEHDNSNNPLRRWTLRRAS